MNYIRILTIALFMFSCQTKDVKKTFYSSGQLKEEYEVEKGMKNGFYIEFHENGKIKTKSVYQNGIIEGLTETYYPNGELYWKVKYKNGQYNGKYTEYDEKGNKVVESAFLEGKQHGKLIEYYDRKRIKLINEYIEGILHGFVREYYPNNRLMFEAKYDDGNLLYYKKYSEEGELAKEYRHLFIKILSDGEIIKGNELKILATYYIDDLDDKSIEWFYSLYQPTGENKYEHVRTEGSTFMISFIPEVSGEYKFEIDVTKNSINYYQDTVFVVGG